MSARKPVTILPLASYVTQVSQYSFNLYCSITIKSESGDIVTADRDKIYAHGNWLGNADLAYVLKDGRSSRSSGK